jgi:O-acetyl-ADP-ribose deacetylase (regulator of RNase III)
MPIVRKVKGNLLDMFAEGEVRLIAHGANCMNVMGAGIAKQIAERFPVALEVDNKFPLPPLYRLGDYSVAQVTFTDAVGDPMGTGTILNFYTQLTPGKAFEYAALKSCLKKLSNEAIANGQYIELAVPRIGAGIGGGDWEIIEKLLEHQEYLLITVVEYEPQSSEIGMDQDDADQTPEA